MLAVIIDDYILILVNFSHSQLYYEFNAPKIKVPIINDELLRDTDVIRHHIVPIRTDFDRVRTNAKTANPPIDYDACTFEEENAPVPYR